MHARIYVVVYINTHSGIPEDGGGEYNTFSQSQNHLKKQNPIPLKISGLLFSSQGCDYFFLGAAAFLAGAFFATAFLGAAAFFAGAAAFFAAGFALADFFAIAF